MALSKADLEAIDALIESRQPTKAEPHETTVVKADLNVGDILTKIATAALLAGVTWLITSVSGMKTTQALIAQEQTNQKVAIEKVTKAVEDGTQDRYTRGDALKDHSAIMERVLQFETKQKSGFTRIEAIEQDIAIMKATTK